MSRVANDTAWKRRVLKEEAVLERKNLAMARTKLMSSSSSGAASNAGSDSIVRKTPDIAVRNTPSPAPGLKLGLQAQHHAVENLREPSTKTLVDPTPRPHSRTVVQDDAQSVSSYSSGTSIQSYPTTRRLLQKTFNFLFF